MVERVSENEYRPEVGAFLRSWSNGIAASDTMWEGRRAWTELKRKGALDVIRCKSKRQKDWRTREPFERIWDAVQRYKSQVEMKFESETEDAEEFLGRVVARIRKKAEKSSLPPIAQFLHGVASAVKKNQRRFPGLKRAMLRSPLGVWGKLLREVESNKRFQQETDMDLKLQLQVAKMLWAVLEDYQISRVTAARLVCLLYWKMGIAAPSDEGLRIIRTGRLLTVKAVDEKLRRAGIFKAKAKTVKART